METERSSIPGCRKGDKQVKIGLDLTSLQGPHRMRGIGYTLINFINNIPAHERNRHAFIFYIYAADREATLNILNLDGLQYEIREIEPRLRIAKRLPSRLGMLTGAANQLIELRDLCFGDSRIRDVTGVEVFLQTDQSQPLPGGRTVVKGLIIYDVIPYALEWDYLWSYKTARAKGFSRKAALRVHTRRLLYILKIKINTRRADKLLSISESTKKDFVRYVSAPLRKIVVTPLGVTMPSSDKRADRTQLYKYVKSPWGYIRRPLILEHTVPFLLFVGGADRRRKLEDVVIAFNKIRARGHKLTLVLAGDSMKGPENISTEEIQSALKKSSYLDDIVFMGFVDDKERDWLYAHALAFIFPSRAEGFGLPVLEAMAHNCPVISYRNEATVEVAADAPTYANSAEELTECILKALSRTEQQVDAIRKKGKLQAMKYDWQRTAQTIIEVISA